MFILKLQELCLQYQQYAISHQMKREDKEISKWVELYSQPLLNKALTMVDNKDDAMDLVQEVFISASSAYHTFEKKSTPLTWLQTILKNKIADFYRIQYRKPQTISITNFFDQSGGWTDDSVLNEWLLNGDSAEEQKALMSVLDKCIEYLPLQWKTTVKLYYLDEKRAHDICRELDIATTNLWKILQRSRMQLRKCLELNWFDKL